MYKLEEAMEWAQKCKDASAKTGWVHLAPDGRAMILLMEEVLRLRKSMEELTDKALAYDLDRAGIERREQEAVELVTLREKVEELSEALHNMVVSAVPGMNWTDETGQLMLKEARKALAASAGSLFDRTAHLGLLAEGISTETIAEQFKGFDTTASAGRGE